MLKRLFTIFMTAVMAMSLCVTVIAENTPKKENIYALWGDFEDEEYYDSILKGKVSYRNSGGLATSSIADIGANGTAHSLKIDHTGPDKTFWIQYMGYPGETYDLSVMVKTDTPEVNKLRICTIYDEKTYYIHKTFEFGQQDGWVEYATTFTVPDFHRGNNIYKGSWLHFIINEETTNYVMYVDEIKVVPHGDVPDADYSVINAGMVDMESWDGVEVTPPAETIDVNFSDIENHWAKGTIEALAKHGYVNGLSNETFAPDGTLTRAQFIKMVSDLYDEEVYADATFSDVAKDSWFFKAVAKADALGIIPDAMKKDGILMPDKAITREEVAAIAAKVAKDRGAKAGKTTVFKDEKDISEWAKYYVSEAVAYGMINGYTNGTYQPKANITRAEASEILMRIIEVSDRFNIYVDAKKGNDSNEGTEKAPLASIEAARDMAKKYAPHMKNDIYIRIRGEQYLEETFKLDETNSGQNGYKIVYTSWGNEQANITMAKKYSGFEIHDISKNIWRVNIGKGTYSRQAYFNDVPGTRARTVGYLKNAQYIMQSHYLCDNTELLDIDYVDELEFVYHINWFNIYHRVSKIFEEDGRIRVEMNRYYFYTPYNRVDYYDQTLSARRQTPSYMENSYLFLDEQGEWYIDKHMGYLYYIPRTGEDMKDMEVKLPIGEEMIRATGKNYNKPLSHIAFDNLILEGTTWLYVEKYGGADFVQNNERNDVVQPSTADETDYWSIYFEACRYIDITDCKIRHLGSAGGNINFYRACKNVNIIGNEIYQIAGNGLCVDYMMYSRPQNRSLNSFCEYFVVENNYIHDIGMDFHGATAVTFGHPRHTKFSHNEVSNVPYSGLHIGWGWEGLQPTGSIMYDFEISYNYIHDVMKERMYDGAAIYINSRSSYECDMIPEAPDKGANKNRIINNYLTNGWNSDYVYPDNSSSSWYVANNVADDGPLQECEFNFDRPVLSREGRFWAQAYHPATYWMTYENNYANEDFGYEHGLMNPKESIVEPVNLVKDGNWPEEAQKIMSEAGIQKEYKEKFNLTGPRIFGCDDRWQRLDLETPTPSGIKILGDFNKEYPLSDFDIQWWIDDPEAVTIDRDGMITAHKSGLYEAEAYLFLDGIWQSQHFLLECDNSPTKVYLNHEEFNLVEGHSANAKLYADMRFSAREDLTNKPEAKVILKSDDSSIATVEKNEAGTYYVITSKKSGTTTIRGTVEYMNKTYEIEVPVNTIEYSNQEAAKLPFEKFEYTNGWKTKGVVVDEIGYAVNGLPNNNQKLYDGLVAFDVSILPGHGWPSFTFSGSNPSGNYGNSDLYMVGFRKEYVELQRFNAGNRTMIFGNSNNPANGPGISNENNTLYEFGKRMSIVMGALETDEGTRIVLNVNGRNIIDFTDTSSQRLPSQGYWAIYNPSTDGGGMTFYPYSGITE